MPYSGGVSFSVTASGISTPMSWIVSVSPFENRSSNVSPSITRVIVALRAIWELFVPGGVTESVGGVSVDGVVFVGTDVAVGSVVAVGVLVCVVDVAVGVLVVGFVGAVVVGVSAVGACVGTVVGIGVDASAGDVSVDGDVSDGAVAAGDVGGVADGFGDVVIVAGGDSGVVAVFDGNFVGVVVVAGDCDSVLVVEADLDVVVVCVTICTVVFSSFPRLIVTRLTDSPSTDEIESELSSLVFSDTALSDVASCFGVQLTRTVRFIEILTSELEAVI